LFRNVRKKTRPQDWEHLHFPAVVGAGNAKTVRREEMTNRFLISVAALALIAGTGLANAQGSRESGGGAQMQSAPSSAGGGAAGGGAMEHENGKAASPSSGMRSEKSPAAGQGQRAEENMPGQKSKGMSSENQKGPPDNMKAEGREDRNANKAAETRQPGRETEKNAQTQGPENEKNAQTERNRENMQAQGREGRETDRNAQNREDRTNMNAQGRTESSTTVGQAGAGAKLSTEQRTRITTIIRNEHVAPVNNVDFSLNVGTRVPRERISLRPLPSEVVTVYPEWRGYEFFLVGDKIVVVDPRSLEIVDILEA
jgi:hypothetical protein